MCSILFVQFCLSLITLILAMKHLLQFILLLAVSVFYQNAFTQHIQRSSMNAFGSVMTQPGLKLSQSVGQSSIVGTSSKPQSFLQQGFQQSGLLADRSDASHEFTIYPNPTAGKIQFLTTIKRNTDVSYKVINSLGAICQEGNFTLHPDKKLQLNHDLKTGTYILQIAFNDVVIHEHLILTK